MLCEYEQQLTSASHRRDGGRHRRGDQELGVPARHAACDRNSLGNAFQAARPSCAAIACIAHDGEL